MRTATALLVLLVALAARGIEAQRRRRHAWGSRRARVLDPQGHEWSFGSYEPGRRW